MKLQYEILALGLKSGMMESRHRMNDSQGDRHDRSLHEDASARPAREEKKHGLYYKFSNFFVDDKENLKDIM